MVADTACVIDLMEGDASALAQLENIAGAGHILSISTLTIFELFTGTAQSHKPTAERERSLGVLEGLPTLPLTTDAAQRAGHLHGTLIKEGMRIGPVDALIAGIALHHNDAVLTRNADELQRVRRLVVKTY